MDTQKRNTITAAVSVVKGDDIVNRPITDLTSALQGNVAGLNFASDAMGGAKGGELGTDIKFNIRGVGSINGGEPYVLVDGIEQSMQNVNPADVASISVLKDARQPRFMVPVPPMVWYWLQLKVEIRKKLK